MTVNVLIIGIDGIAPTLIEKWMDDLPNIKRLIKNGVFCNHKSTLPPLTSPSWNCLNTGKNPAKLGIFDWINYDVKKGSISIVNYTNQDSSSLWDVLGDNGIRVILVNIPTTYPPSRVNGIMISGGVLTPFAEKGDFTYPSSFKEELKGIVKDYELLPVVDLRVKNKEEEYIKKFENVLDKQTDVVKYLLKNKKWDFCEYVIFVSDQIQHYFWHHMDSKHPKHDDNTPYKDAIKSFYIKIDEKIGELLSCIPENTYVIVVSDHGFGPVYGRFRINEWLLDNGYLILKNDRRNHLLEFLIAMRIRFLRYITPNHPLVKIFIRLMPQRLLDKVTHRGNLRKGSEGIIKSINWEKTEAYALGEFGQIYINLKGRNPNGTVNPSKYKDLVSEIREKLAHVKDPIEGNNKIIELIEKKDIYKGKYFTNAPDLFPIICNGKYIADVNIGRKEIWDLDYYLTGWHTLDGLFVATGPGIKKGVKFRDISIYDIVPTVLHIFNIPIPKDMDGRVLKEIFKPDSEPAKRPIIYQEVGEKERIRERIGELKAKRKL